MNTRQDKKNRDEVQRMFNALADVGEDISSCGYDFGFFLIYTKSKKMTSYMNSHTDSTIIAIATMLQNMTETKEELQDLIDRITFIAGGMYDEG